MRLPPIGELHRIGDADIAQRPSLGHPGDLTLQEEAAVAAEIVDHLGVVRDDHHLRQPVADGILSAKEPWLNLRSRQEIVRLVQEEKTPGLIQEMEQAVKDQEYALAVG